MNHTPAATHGRAFENKRRRYAMGSSCFNLMLDAVFLPRLAGWGNDGSPPTSSERRTHLHLRLASGECWPRLRWVGSVGSTCGAADRADALAHAAHHADRMNASAGRARVPSDIARGRSLARRANPGEASAAQSLEHAVDLQTAFSAPKANSRGLRSPERATPPSRPLNPSRSRRRTGADPGFTEWRHATPARSAVSRWRPRTERN